MRKKIYCSGWGAISELVPKPERNRLPKLVIKRKRRSSHGSWLFDNLRAFEQILLFVHSCRSSYDSKVLGQVLNKGFDLCYKIVNRMKYSSTYTLPGNDRKKTST